MNIGKIFVIAYVILFSLYMLAGVEKDITSARNLTNSLESYLKYSDEILAFTNAIIIDGTGVSQKTGQTLLIHNGIIQAMGNQGEIEIPKNATIIDLSGKTIIPGLIGMHNHLHIPRFPFLGDVAAKLYLASGVTTIQTAGAADAQKELELSKQIAKGNHIGPEIIPSAPFITGPGGNPNMIIPRNEEHLRDTLQYWFNQGIKWVKVYRNTKPEDLEIIIDEAHKNNVKVRGHLCSITFEEATLMGIDGIEHGLNSTADFRSNKDYGICNGGREYMDELDISSTKVKELQKLMIENGVTLTSTLSIYEASVPNRAYASSKTLELMSPYLLNQYQERRKRLDAIKNDLTREQRLKRIMEFEYQFFKMGGLLCSGVDAGRHVLPGFGDQRNFQLFVEAGFTTEEAIQVMTGNGAKALDRDDIGILQVGKKANFVILEGDLSKDASTIEKIETVFKEGIGYDPQSILRDLKGKFGQP
ncbi:amidohydrolase family protein [Gracilimonas tropica]|uniref:amidohydrolase family protein n=1 Tax=Gracilimonas tropica TaxID=454600 RepID=UPI00035C0E87|nr:amidohydrolase family protein [Gracilimonas tropica]